MKVEEFVYQSNKFTIRNIEIVVSNVESHRNGISGEGFFVVTFTDDEVEGGRFVGIVFHNLLKQNKNGYVTGLTHESFIDKGWTNPQVAVLEIGMLNEGNIGRDNMWRGDHYLPVLAKAIVDYEKQRKKYNDRMYKKDAEDRGGY